MLKVQQDRNQFQMLSLESIVPQNSMVRLIDSYVDTLDVEGLGFKVKGKIKNGAPAYHCKDLLKLYYYGYLNRIRSSRRLERESKTNLEAMWLVRGAQPGYKTIANFRKDNLKGLKNAFKDLNRFLIQLKLIDTQEIGIDGSKYRAQNSKKNNYSEKKIKKQLDYIDKHTKAYLNEMTELDKIEGENEIYKEQCTNIAEQLNKLQVRKDKYEKLRDQLKEGKEEGVRQVSTTDVDSRALAKKTNVVEVSYNVVASADVENKFILNFQVLNESDIGALSSMAIEARELLGKTKEDSFTVIADKGFEAGKEFKRCVEENITTVVAPREKLSKKANKKYGKEAFEYDEDSDQYKCPAGEILKTNGTWHKRKDYSSNRIKYRYQRYTISFNKCRHCPFKEDCVSKTLLENSKGRFIERSENERYIEENIARYKVSKECYRQRQSTIEHQFGTIKRQWGYDYTLLKGLEKVDGEMSIIFTCYNLRRAITILGVKELIERIKEYQLSFFVYSSLILSCFKGLLDLCFLPFFFIVDFLFGPIERYRLLGVNLNSENCLG